MLGTREFQIISLIIFNKNIKTEDIQTELNLTKRQIGYSCDKVNRHLLENDIPVIERMTNGTFLMLEDTRQYFIKIFLLPNSNLKDEINVRSFERKMPLDIQIRRNLLFLLLTCKKEHLEEISIFLDVSQNTVLTDIKNLQERIIKYDLTVNHVRSKGYSIVGEEKVILLLQLKIIDLIQQKNKSFNLIKFFGYKSEKIIDLILGAEKSLGVKYSDDSFESLQNYLFIFLFRIKNVDNRKFYFGNDIKNTVEFKYFDEILDQKMNLQLADKEWISLLFLSANTLQNNKVESGDKIYDASFKFTEEFERMTFTTISDKATFVKRLYSHVRPLIFRTLYNLPLLGIDLRDYFKNEEKKMSYLFKSIKHSIYPLENLIGKKISDDEIKLISFYFGSELSFGRPKRALVKKRALVVCSNGLVTAKIMKDNLSRLFPEINFVKTASAREFMTSDTRYEVIFTTIPLNTKKLQYVINPVMKKEQERSLKKKVLSDLGIESVDKQISQIIKIVEKHASVKNISELKDDLCTFMTTPSNEKKQKNPRNNKESLSDFVKPEYIQFSTGNVTWKEALRRSAKPLISDNVIKEEYVNELEKQISNPNSYSFLKEIIAIPHAVPKLGAYDNGFGFFISKKPIKFPGHHQVLIVVPIAITGEKDYMNAINQLMILAKDKVLIRRLCHTNSVDIVTKLLKNLGV